LIFYCCNGTCCDGACCDGACCTTIFAFLKKAKYIKSINNKSQKKGIVGNINILFVMFLLHQARILESIQAFEISKLKYGLCFACMFTLNGHLYRGNSKRLPKSFVSIFKEVFTHKTNQVTEKFFVYQNIFEKDTSRSIASSTDHLFSISKPIDIFLSSQVRVDMFFTKISLFISQSHATNTLT
jgi:hypothetical protein